MNHDQTFASQRIDFGDVDGQGWRGTRNIVRVADNLGASWLESRVVAQLFQHSNAHEAVQPVIKLFNGRHVDTNTGVLAG